MWFDPTTLFAGLIASITVGGAMLLWSWYEDQSELVLAWSGAGFLLAGIGVAALGARDEISPHLSQTLGPAVVLLGLGCTWAGARAFSGRSTPVLAVAVGMILWIALSFFPPIFAAANRRAACGSALIAVFLLLAARELLRGPPLRGRKPLATLLVVHAVAVAARIPLALEFIPAGTLPLQTKWLGVMVLEGMAFAQISAVLLITLTKERLETRLRQMAETDPLTGLCNRRALFEHGTAALAACSRAQTTAAVLIFDLDEFKEVNDTFGHAVGDAVLQAFGTAAVECLAKGDVVGRIGGEEFALVLPGRDQPAASAIARRLMARFKQLASQVEGHAISCTASGGLAMSGNGRESIDTLLCAADAALYDAKREGINTLRLAS